MEILTYDYSKLAIVILNWNGKKWLEKFLPSVVSFSQNANIYVIDNASTDDSILFLNEKFSQVKIIHNKENYGFAKGYNEGLRNIKEEFYCLLNSDVEVSHNWLQPILALFEKDENIAAIQPKILSYNDKSKFEFAGAGGGFIDNFGFPYCRGRIFFSLEKDFGQYNDTTEIFWASGACLFIREKDFWAEKGFDDYFFAHMEEIDLCWRLKNSGKKIYYSGMSTVYHIGGGTLNVNNPRKTFLNFRNNLLMLLKNLPNHKLFYVISIRLIFDGIAAFKFLFSNGFGHLWAVFTAHLNFYWKFIPYLRKRKSGITNYFDKENIVWKYFVYDKKIYDDLD